MRRKNNAARSREMAMQRIERLFELAMHEHDLHPERSDRYVQIARKISTRIRIRMPSQIKRRFCRHCGCYLAASGSRVRLSQGLVTTTCLRCGKQTRRPYRRRSQSLN